MIRSP